MYVARVSTRIPLTKQTAARFSKAVASYGLQSNTAGLRLSHRHFSSTPATRLRDYFPEPEHNQITKTDPAWPHPP